jgi:hypothetical protein
MNQSTPDITNTAAFPERQKAAQAAIANASDIARRSGSAKAQRIAAFIARAHVMAAPLYENGGMAHERELSGDEFYLAAIRSADAHLQSTDPYVAYFSRPAGTTWSGAYRSSIRTLFLPLDWPIAPMMTGLTLLHEGLHAWEDVTGMSDESPFWLDEVHARKLEYAVLCGLNGSRFTKLCDSVAPFIAASIESTGNPREFDEPDEIDEGLADTFGQALNRYDKVEQTTFFRRAALCRYMYRTHAKAAMWEQIVPGDATEPWESGMPATESR